jgi:hypothetical protein
MIGKKGEGLSLGTLVGMVLVVAVVLIGAYMYVRSAGTFQSSTKSLFTCAPKPQGNGGQCDCFSNNACPSGVDGTVHQDCPKVCSDEVTRKANAASAKKSFDAEIKQVKDSLKKTPDLKVQRIIEAKYFGQCCPNSTG